MAMPALSASISPSPVSAAQYRRHRSSPSPSSRAPRSSLSALRSAFQGAPPPLHSTLSFPPRAQQICPLRPMASASPPRPVAAAVATEPAAAQNPLLSTSRFPPFDKVEASHVVPGMTQVLSELTADLEALEGSVKPTLEGLVQPLERLGDRLSSAWGMVQHLKAVKDSETLRKAVEEVQPGVVTLTLKFGQSKPLFEAFKQIQEDKELWGSLSDAQKRIVESEIESAKASGVALEGAAKERFNAIQQELAELSRKFSNNVLDATNKFSKLVSDPTVLDGLPATALSLAAQQAVAKGHKDATPEKGPWLLTLDLPCYQPVLQHCKNRSLREEIYKAYITRASEGDLDNSGIISSILQLRKERAQLLGYENHAEGVMVRRMATLETATKLLEDIREAAWEASVKELEEVKDFARSKGAPEADSLSHWDVSYWAEKMREAKYELTEEELRPYFALPAVLNGLFALTTKLFAVTIEAADGEAPVWHKDVSFFRVKDAAGDVVAHFYLDPYSRPAEKQGGAWMNPLVGRSKQMAEEGERVRKPVAVLVCNQMMPVGEKPSLMTFREVETLFHEFGHGLQHMLTVQDESTVAGIANVEWDAVELPSQFMENWCYHRDTLLGMAKHYETGETLPEDLYQKLLAARTYRAASVAMRQLHFATVDLDLHSRFDAAGSESVLEANDRVAKRMLVMPPLPEDRFLNSFRHIFAGGYAAGYYGYKWAEVLSADAFSAFEEAGLNDDKAVAETGKRFRDTVLSLGGGKPAMEVFEAFRGRQPSIEPLLRHNGLIPANA